MLALAAGLRGQGLLIKRVSDLLYGDSVALRIEVDSSFEEGSLVVPVYIVNDLKTAQQFLAGPTGTAIANLLAILGFGSVGSLGITLYWLFRRLKGRPISNPNDLPPNLNINITVENLVRIYNDTEVQVQLRNTVDPLRHSGIDEFQTRRNGTIIERVSKRDLQAADDAELDAFTKDEEIELAIEKAAWRRHLAWHFRSGDISFDAKIEDEIFWKRVEQGEPFADGDRLRVHLRTTARRTANGHLKLERLIPKVFSVEHARKRQRTFFDEEQDG